MVIDGAERLKVCGIELEVVRRGTGRPMLLLHGFQTLDPHARFLELLGRYCDIVAPSSPGFGHSPRPKDFDTVYDLVHLYLELMETLPSNKVTLVGFSFGGWLATEVAVACSHRLDKLVLVEVRQRAVIQIGSELIGQKISNGRDALQEFKNFLHTPRGGHSFRQSKRQHVLKKPQMHVMFAILSPTSISRRHNIRTGIDVSAGLHRSRQNRVIFDRIEFLNRQFTESRLEPLPGFNQIEQLKQDDSKKQLPGSL